MFTKILILLLVLCATQSFITDFWSNEVVNGDILLCLKHKSYLEDAFIRAEFNPVEKDWEVNVDPLEFEKIGIKPQLVISTFQLTGQLPPLLEARRIFRQFDQSPVSKYWISLSAFQGSFRPSCHYLRILTSALALFSGKEVGIQTQELFWTDLFGDRFACPQLASHDLFLSFNDFKLFGGWQDFSYFETYQLVNACGSPGMQVFKK